MSFQFGCSKEKFQCFKNGQVGKKILGENLKKKKQNSNKVLRLMQSFGINGLANLTK